MQIRNPCKRCLVRPMCKYDCNLYNDWIKKAAYVAMYFTGFITAVLLIGITIIGIQSETPALLILLYAITFTISYTLYKFIPDVREFVSDVFNIDNEIIAFFLSIYSAILIILVNSTHKYMKSR